MVHHFFRILWFIISVRFTIKNRAYNPLVLLDMDRKIIRPAGYEKETYGQVFATKNN